MPPNQLVLALSSSASASSPSAFHSPSPLPYDYDDNTGIPFPTNPQDPDDTLALLLPLLILLTTLLFLLLIFLLFLIFRRTRSSIHLGEEGGPTNLEREDEFDAEGGLEGLEERWLEEVDNNTKIGYQRAKVWQSQYPPNSQPTDITLSQFLSIQEKGVSAWSFEPDYESNPALIVQSRTEITFLSDGVGMAPEEGGGCCVQSNLPLPKLNEVYYWECKMFEKPVGTTVSIGLATKPYPSFRLPGSSKYSVGYFSSDGFKAHSYPFTAQSYGPPLTEGDTLGVGYRPRTGTVFFTRNGKKLDDAFVGLNRHNLFPTVGANAACTIHVNLGQAGFVFIEANVKKWGLAPMMGTLAPPPAYGSERGSILLESAAVGGSAASPDVPTHGRTTRGMNPTLTTTPAPPRTSSSTTTSNSSSSSRRHSSRRSSRRDQLPPIPSSSSASAATTPAGAVSALATSSSQPIRPSPLRHSRQASNLSLASTASTSSQPPRSGEAYSSDGEGLRNPPTPGLFDVSLESLHHHRPSSRDRERDEEGDTASGSEGSDENSPEGSPLLPTASTGLGLTNINPPAYFPVDPNRYPDGVAQAMLSDVFPSFNFGGSGGNGQGPVNLTNQRGYPAGLAEFQNGSGFSENSSQRNYEAGMNGQNRNGANQNGGASWWSSWFSGTGASSS